MAEQGNAAAQFNLGVMYSNGHGVTLKTIRKPLSGTGLLLEQGDAGAQYNLAQKYADGRGVIEDYKEAAKWYRLAAEQGNAVAQYGPGFHSRHWPRRYSRRCLSATCGGILRRPAGNEEARDNKDILVKEMTPQDISKAQDLARECVKKNYKGC